MIIFSSRSYFSKLLVNFVSFLLLPYISIISCFFKPTEHGTWFILLWYFNCETILFIISALTCSGLQLAVCGVCVCVFVFTVSSCSLASHVRKLLRSRVLLSGTWWQTVWGSFQPDSLLNCLAANIVWIWASCLINVN